MSVVTLSATNEPAQLLIHMITILSIAKRDATITLYTDPLARNTSILTHNTDTRAQISIHYCHNDPLAGSTST